MSETPLSSEEIKAEMQADMDSFIRATLPTRFREMVYEDFPTAIKVKYDRIVPPEIIN